MHSEKNAGPGLRLERAARPEPHADARGTLFPHDKSKMAPVDISSTFVALKALFDGSRAAAYVSRTPRSEHSKARMLTAPRVEASSRASRVSGRSGWRLGAAGP